jgi:23S rRNA pseudouridine2605 synthase
MPVRIHQDRITVDGKPVAAQTKIYLMMNKPHNVITTAADEKGRETIYTVLNKLPQNYGFDMSDAPWLAPVGRLDKASEGLLLLTNDSEWAARVAAPETQLDKTYHVQIATLADEQFLQALCRGIKAKDGETLRAKQVRVLRSGQKNCWLEIILDGGKNRQIRRMIEGMGSEVLRLVRTAIGPLELGGLKKGDARPLTREDKRMLDRAM